MSRNTRLIAAVAAVLVLSGAFYNFALKPKREEASKLQGQITEQQAALDAARELLANNQAARKDYRAAYAAVVRLGKAVQLPPGATVGPAGFPVMPFSFAFTGSFFDLGNFFRHIEDMVKQKRQQLAVNGRLLTLEGLQLAPDSEGFPKIRATVNATSYLVSPLEGATGGATAQGPAGAVQPGTTGSTGTGATPGSGSGTTAPAPTTATSTGVIR